jgi:hypothetical protein
MDSVELNREMSTRPLTLEEAKVMRDILASMTADDVVLSVADLNRLIARFGREKLRRMMVGRH